MHASREGTHASASSSATPQSQANRAEAPPPSLTDALGRTWDELRGLLHDHLLLVSLEARQAAASLIRMLAIGMACAALMVGAWAVAMMAILMWLLDTGLSVAAALGLLAAVTVLAAAVLAWQIRRLVRDLVFPATFRRLSDDPLPGAEP